MQLYNYNLNYYEEQSKLNFFLLLSSLDEEEESSTEEDESNVEDSQCDKVSAVDKASSAKETEAGAEISALVNYVQPVHFNSFESAESTFICITIIIIKLIFLYII